MTPWDQGAVPQAVRDFLASENRHLRVLIPGCGAAYEVRAFVGAGHEVIAIDFSAAAIEAARRTLGPLADRLLFGDFFTHDFNAPFDLVYERAFLCALPRSHWRRWAARVAQMLPPGGRLAGFFFWSDEERGPPFGLTRGELESLLTPTFDRLEDASVSDSIPIFAERERWQIWRRC